MSLTIISIFSEDRKVEICSVTKTALDHNFTFEFEYGDTCAIELDSGRVFLRFELVEDGGSHDVGCRAKELSC